MSSDQTSISPAGLSAATDASGSRGGQIKAPPPSLYAWYVAFILMLTYALSGLDRKLPYILVESIKKDLHLSDTQVGLLTGPVFALVYATMGIPVAALLDRRNRKKILGWAILIWSALTALGGFANGFWHLALCRVGVAAGEATCSPGAHSLIGDYFSPQFRARALSLYVVGSPFGMLLGLVLGGWVNELADWRLAMILLGLPGVILALVILFTVKEPERTKSAAPQVTLSETDHKAPSVNQAAKIIMGQPVVAHLFIGSTFLMLTLSSVQAFGPAFIIRKFGLGTAAIGITYGLALGGAGILGAALGGFIGDHIRKTSPWKAIAFVGLGLGLTAPVLAACFMTQSYALFLGLLFVSHLIIFMNSAPVFATVQSLLGPRLYAMAAAFYLLGCNGIGLSVGPLLTGVVSDALKASGHPNPLGLALTLVTLVQLLAAGHFAFAAVKLRTADAARSNERDLGLSCRSESRG